MGAKRLTTPKVSTNIPPEVCVTIPRSLDRKELVEMDTWLQKDSCAEGEYWRTVSHWHKDEPAALFVFTDPNTACLFKVRWV